MFGREVVQLNQVDKEDKEGFYWSTFCGILPKSDECLVGD